MKASTVINALDFAAAACRTVELDDDADLEALVSSFNTVRYEIANLEQRIRAAKVNGIKVPSPMKPFHTPPPKPQPPPKVPKPRPPKAPKAPKGYQEFLRAGAYMMTAGLLIFAVLLLMANYGSDGYTPTSTPTTHCDAVGCEP